jgi:hypothetical protein
MSGGDGTNSVLKYILSDVRGLLRLRPFVPGSYDRHFPRPGVGNAYPFVGSHWVHFARDLGSFPRLMREARWAVRW